MSSEPTPRPTQRLLVCGVCGRTSVAVPDELLTYVRSHWPKCCGEVMRYFVEAHRPGYDDTPLAPRGDPPT
jgi:hypothetical protein